MVNTGRINMPADGGVPRNPTCPFAEKGNMGSVFITEDKQNMPCFFLVPKLKRVLLPSEFTLDLS